MDLALRLPSHWLSSSRPKGRGPSTVTHFVDSVMSYTKMDVPTVELYETAVTFGPQHADPLSAHLSLTRTLRQESRRQLCVPCRHDLARAAIGSTRGDPWLEPPPRPSAPWHRSESFYSCAEGLPYRFAIEACVGRERTVDGDQGNRSVSDTCRKLRPGLKPLRRSSVSSRTFSTSRSRNCSFPMVGAR